MRKVFNHSGFSIIEALVVVVLVALMAISFATVMVGHQQASLNLQQTLEANQIGEAVTAFLGEVENCNRNFAGKSTSGSTDLSALRNSAGTTVFSTAPTSTVGNMVKLEKIELTGPAYTIPDVGTAVKLRLYFAKTGSSTGGALAPREIDLVYEGGSSITTCRSRPPRVAQCRTYQNSTSGTRVSVNCVLPYKVYSCGWRDDQPAKRTARNFYQIPVTSSNPAGGCYCEDGDAGGNLYCHALCCVY